MKAGWEVKKLDNVCDLITCGVAARPHYTDAGIPFLSAKNVKNGKIIWSGYNCISEVTHKELTKHNKPLIGDILYTRVGSFGEAAVIEEDQEFSVFVSLTLIKPKKDLLNNYFLKHYLNSSEVKELAKRSISSSGVGNLNVGTVRAFPIALPSLDEQQRIVAILDQAFEGIAKARANAEQNLQNARALFESHLQSVFTQRGEGWVETKLGAEIDLLVGFAFKSTHYTTSPDDVRLLRGDNIIQGHLRWEDVKMWPSNDASIYSQYSLREGDVVLAMDRPWVKAGLKHATISADDLPCLLVQRTACLRAKMNLENRFLVYILGSAAFTNHILGVQTGIGVPHISGQQIKDFQFSRPPINEQKHIAQSLDSLQIQMRSLEALYQRKIALLDELKKSLLQQAFAGEL